jgi:hypothetical protein
VAICSQIVNENPDPFAGNPLLDQFLSVAERWTAHESKGIDATDQLAELRRIALLMFRSSIQDSGRVG